MPELAIQEAVEIGALCIESLYEALEKSEFNKDLQTVLDSGVSHHALAQLLGVNRQNVDNWVNGSNLCRDRFIHLAVKQWADGLREKQG